MDVDKLLIIGLLAIAFSPLALAEDNTTNITFSAYCPYIACVDDTITLWVMYENNTIPYNESYVYADDGNETYQLFWNSTNQRYQADFSSNVTSLWEYDIKVDNYTQSCSTEFADCFGLTVNLWEEVPTERVPGSDVVVKNYDKQLNDPYINDFAYLVVKNNDINISVWTNESCNLPWGSGQKFLEILNMGNWMGENLTKATANLFGGTIGCDNYWFRAPYLDGTSTVKLPYTGNYSLWLIDGVMLWNNEHSPPDIVKSDLFLYLGDLNVDVPINQTQDFWVSHQELDFWSSVFASFYLPMLLIIPLVILATPFFFGVPFRFAIGLALAWMAIWTILRLNGI